MARYRCEIEFLGSRLDDHRGFDAADDQEMREIVRAIAAILRKRNPTAGEATLTVYNEAGEFVHAATLRDSTIQ